MKIQVVASSSSGNFYIIHGEREKLLLECGIPVKEIKKSLGFDFGNIAGCLISHEHGDHSKAAKDIVKMGIDTYMSEGTKQGISVPESHRINVVGNRDQRDIGEEFTVLFLETQHDCNEPLGFVTLHKPTEKKILFVTDSYYFKFCVPGLTHIMIEANYSKEILDRNIETGRVHPGIRDRIVTSHFEIEHLKEFFQANDLSKLEKILLIHLSNDNSDEAKFKEAIEVVTCKPTWIAGPGLMI
ncbi:MAG: MBL fold metallo-hydrolase [Candidatus Magnetobacterium sp. LHC-1]